MAYEMAYEVSMEDEMDFNKAFAAAEALFPSAHPTEASANPSHATEAEVASAHPFHALAQFLSAHPSLFPSNDVEEKPGECNYIDLEPLETNNNRIRAIRQELFDSFSGSKEADKVESKPFDVVTLFSNPDIGRDFLVRGTDDTHVKLDTLLGKYLVIWCVSLPLITSLYLNECQILFDIYHTLVDRAGGDLEVVIVADADNMDNFNGFISDFPGLTVPFSDLQSRASICKHLGLTEPQTTPVAGVILDPRHRVVREDYSGQYFTRFGADFFPFNLSKVKSCFDIQGAVDRKFGGYSINAEDDVFPPVSFADLLMCEPNVMLYRLTPSGQYEEMSVGEMSRKNCVGVYLCFDFSFMSELAGMYKQCKEKGLEFEVVLVCHWSNWSLEEFKQWCRQYEDMSSFWLFPYIYESARRVKSFSTYVDSVLVVRPGDKSWDIYGRGIMLSGGTYLYPFTRESVKERITSFTLLEPFPDKNVLVYVYQRKHFDRSLLWLLRKVWSLRRSSPPGVPDLQVVVAPTRGDAPPCCGEDWVVLQPSDAIRAIQHLFTPAELLENSVSTIVAFGKDGRMLSRRAQIYLKDLELPKIEALFAGNMQEEEDAYLDTCAIKTYMTRVGPGLDLYEWSVGPGRDVYATCAA